MNDFLCGAGFSALAASFGWPSVRTWSVWASHLGPDLASAAWATRDPAPIPPHAPPGELRGTEGERARADVERGAVAAIAGFEPTTWTTVRFRLWTRYPDVAADLEAQVYQVGHMSIPARKRG